jgi:hypothetical protein
MTFDPVILLQRGAVGFAADLAQAREWCDRAKDLGSIEPRATSNGWWLCRRDGEAEPSQNAVLSARLGRARTNGDERDNITCQALADRSPLD